jgi:pathogenesis-related protein 1
MLAEHNTVRARLGLPPLAWSGKLVEFARAWANHLLATGAFEHRKGNSYGENLYTITGGSASPTQAVRAWADESRDYDIRTNTCRGMCGHYTQIVWKTTRLVGCAVAAARGREVWVCNYDPPGNWVGTKPY